MDGSRRRPFNKSVPDCTNMYKLWHAFWEPRPPWPGAVEVVTSVTGTDIKERFAPPSEREEQHGQRERRRTRITDRVRVPNPWEVQDKGLKKGAIGYLSNIVIGVASTAPACAYSLAATLGFIVAVNGVGVHAPAVLLVAFVPMLAVASAYKYFNRADPTLERLSPVGPRAPSRPSRVGQRRSIFLSDVIVMASLADIAAVYTFKLFGFTQLGESKTAIILGAVLWVAIMTWICYRGIELSARIQHVLLGARDLHPGLCSRWSLFVKVYVYPPASGSIKPSLSWINPFAMNFGDLVVAAPAGRCSSTGAGIPGSPSTRSQRTRRRARARQRWSRRCCSC